METAVNTSLLSFTRNHHAMHINGEHQQWYAHHQLAFKLAS
ncbi:MAG: hypothetical protein WD469_15285 [Paenibacillaceae bacterium]